MASAGLRLGCPSFSPAGVILVPKRRIRPIQLSKECWPSKCAAAHSSGSFIRSRLDTVKNWFGDRDQFAG